MFYLKLFLTTIIHVEIIAQITNVRNENVHIQEKLPYVEIITIQQALAMVKIPTPQVRYLYPT